MRLVADENCDFAVVIDLRLAGYDFGQLVFAAAKQNSGVILIRYPASARAALSAAVVKLFTQIESWR